MVIINKVEVINNKLVYTEVGYVGSGLDYSQMHFDYEITIGKWIKENIGSLQQGYDIAPYVGGPQFLAKTRISYSVSKPLPIITDINQLK